MKGKKNGGEKEERANGRRRQHYVPQRTQSRNVLVKSVSMPEVLIQFQHVNSQYCYRWQPADSEGLQDRSHCLSVG